MTSSATDSDEQLRRIEAVTDPALSQLDAEDLLYELLERTRDLMAVDTAVVLLLDPHARQLVTVASRGLAEDARQAFRVSVGRGFVGQVARDAGPVVIDRVDAANLVHPQLAETGVTSLLGVPLLAEGSVIGVLHVGTHAPREFTDDDVKLLEVVADRASMAGQARLNRADRNAALALQRGLLPATLPEVPGVELAARYLPGHDAGVGGDWYDVFPLPSGWLGVVVGDVVGHGLRSAVVMGRLRSALRAYTLVCDDPAEALTQLDRKIQHFEAGSLSTALYAMVSPDRRELRLSLAGHPPPVLADPAGKAELVPVPTDLPLGLRRPAWPRRTTTIELAPDSLLVCYTDGLIERRGEIIDVGLDRLRAAVTPGSAEAVAAALMDSVAAEQPADDIALLVLRRLAAD